MTPFIISLQSVRFHVRSWLPARSIVFECLATRRNVDPSGEIMILDRFSPVSGAVFSQTSRFTSFAYIYVACLLLPMSLTILFLCLKLILPCRITCELLFI